MKIDVLANDGSPLGITLQDLWGEGNRGIGVGGAEYAILTLCEEWHKAGHLVTFYNNPLSLNGSPFEQRNINMFDPSENRDVLIIFRSPNLRAYTAKGLKIWLSMDQQTIGNFAKFAKAVDTVVCISQRHAQYFDEHYGIHNSIVIDIPVRIDDFIPTEKVKNRLVFTSVPARGLDNLWRMYPLIQHEIPDMSLAITSDYRLWGSGAGNETFRMKWMKQSNVEFFGALPRKQYLEELMKSQIILYPCNYDELFCVSIAEAQYAGVYPVTSSAGALATTNMGTVLNLDASDYFNDRMYAEEVIWLLSNPHILAKSQKAVREKAKERFSPSKILDEWNRRVFI